MPESKTVRAGTVVAFLVGAVLGSGSLWQWKQSRLDEQKQQLETVVKTTELRQQENAQYANIIQLTNEYIRDKEQYSKTPAPELNNRIVQLKAQLDVMKDDFRTLEGKLAGLEGREPRRIEIEFMPPEAPTNLRATVQ